MLAHMWFSVSAAAGDKNAATLKEQVTKLMNPKQIAESEKLAKECQARNFKNCD
jgi:hypothetical protein